MKFVVSLLPWPPFEIAELAGHTAYKSQPRRLENMVLVRRALLGVALVDDVVAEALVERTTWQGSKWGSLGQ